MFNTLHDLFLLDPRVIFLNHGSFGACPKSVFETYQRWQVEMERQPVEFLGRRYDALLDEVRNELGTYLNASADDLILLPNSTHGTNLVARSLKLQPGDEILATDHEYGAVDYTWEYVCEQTGAKYIRHPIDLPLGKTYDIVNSLWSAVTPRTKVIAISHITSPTALILPIKEICDRARRAGIMTIIDGAHAPGQIPLDLGLIDADFYTGNLHKWLCAPKGAAFLFARKQYQDLLDPLVISWGWRSRNNSETTTFVTRNQWQGTRDIAAFLSIPAAIEFQQQHNWDIERERCHYLAMRTRDRICELTGIPPIAPDSFFSQMFAVKLPACDVMALKERLYNEYKIELPGIIWNGMPFLRISVQGYNTENDMDKLIEALQVELALT
ncbi:MAG: aminotransferase class V-fold PLP-dependent enzyme [Aggregatilineales bacterium]